MSRPLGIHKPVFVSLALAYIAAAWWGCAGPETQPADPSGTTTEGATTGSGGMGGAGGST